MPRWQRFVLAVSVLCLGAAHLMTLGYVKYANQDEAYGNAIAERLLEGHRLYDGAVSQRGPLFYYALAFFAKLTRWDSVLAVRVFALAFGLAHLAVAYYAARALFSRRAAVFAVAVCTYGLAFGTQPYDGLALHAEAILVPPLVLAVVLGALAMREAPGSRPRVWRLVGAGLLFGAALSIKQTALVQPLPLALWLLVDAYSKGTPWRTWAKDAGAFLGAVAAIPGVLLLHAWYDGTLRQLLYYCFEYNLLIHTKHTKFLGHVPVYVFQGYPLFFACNAAALALVCRPWIARVGALVRTRSRHALFAGFSVVDYVSLQYACAFVVAASIPQVFEHYYILVLPLLALVLATHVHLVTRAPRAKRVLRTMLVGAAAAAIYAAGQVAWLREKVDGRVGHGELVEKAAKYIEKHTSPDDRIFVWGFSPWLYEYSHRRPAGRFVFTTYPIGFVPWFWSMLDWEPSRVVPGAMDQLLGDLDREKPEYVVDAGAVFIARSMRAYPQSSAWLHAHYCFDARIGAFDMYRRATDAHPCEVDYFPRAPGAVDYFDTPINVPMPMTVDFPTSRWLPGGDPKKPIRFDFSRDVCIDDRELYYQGRPDAKTCNFGTDPMDDWDAPPEELSSEVTP